MGNDFFEKYANKGSDDLANIEQDIAANITANVAETTQQQGAAPIVDAPQTGESKTAESKTASMRFEQTASNGFVAPAPRATGAASHARAQKTIAGVPVLYIGCAVAAIVLLALIFFFTGRGTSVQALEGWTLSEVEMWANENKVMLRVEEEYSDAVDSGDVIVQSPAAGERISGSDFLTVTVSRGPDLSVMVPVPDIMNMSMSEVEAWAAENFMTTVRITTQNSETVPSGKAISFTINDNTVTSDEVRRDTPFYVIFSKGVGSGTAVKVPNFLTLSVDEAQAFATENEIILTISEEFSDTVSKGNIISQSVKADETVYTGDEIVLKVSKGKEVLVPNFASLSRELAAAKAAQLGITTIVEEKYSTLAKDTLISQSMAAGALYGEDDIIVLVYSSGNKFVVPSFVGQNESDVRAWIEPLNENGAKITVSTTYTENTASYGTVLSQDKIDYTIGIDGNIQLVVSKGMPVIVPNFVQTGGSAYGTIITKADVLAQCDALGIVAIFVEEATSASDRVAGEVWYQSIAAGTEIKVGDTITIKLQPASSEAKVTVPDFTNMAGGELSDDAKVYTFTYIDQHGADIAASNIASYTVTAQSVPEGTVVSKGCAITLTMKMTA